MLVFNNESKFYSYSFVLVPELLKEHSPLSTLFELLFTDWRRNLKTHSKDLRRCLKNISLSLRLRSKHARQSAAEFYTEFSEFSEFSLLRKMGEYSSCFKILHSKSDRWVRILLVHGDFAPRLRLIQER